MQIKQNVNSSYHASESSCDTLNSEEIQELLHDNNKSEMNLDSELDADKNVDKSTFSKNNKVFFGF